MVDQARRRAAGLDGHGERVERPYVLHVYSVKEWLEMLREAGFEEVEAFGSWDGETPIGPDVWRLILRAR